jgi:hypothetical protein
VIQHSEATPFGQCEKTKKGECDLRKGYIEFQSTIPSTMTKKGSIQGKIMRKIGLYKYLNGRGKWHLCLIIKTGILMSPRINDLTNN